MCPGGSTQNRTVDTRTVRTNEDIPKCVRNDLSCPPETIPDTKGGNSRECVCDTSRGYVGDDYLLCTKHLECPYGLEFSKHDGSCTPCPPGTFKSVSGYRTCELFTKCMTENRETVTPGNATSDTVCGEPITGRPLPSFTTATVLRLQPSSDDYQTQANILQSSNRQELSKEPTSNCKKCEVDNHRYLVFLVAVGMLCVVLVMFTIIMLRIRRINRKGTLTVKEGGIPKYSSQLGVQPEQHAEPGRQSRITSEGILHGTKPESTAGQEYPLMEYPEEENWIIPCHPESMTTFYPEIHETPCAPTAPPLSINIR